MNNKSMALDRNNRSMPYVAGRMIAIAEHYAGKKFGPGTVPNMFTHPAHGVDAWQRYIDTTDEYYQELVGLALPVTLANEVEKGQAWVGYYHQKAEYGDTQRGGMRLNSGRKSLGKKAVTLKLSEASCDKLAQVQNKSEFVDELIKKAKI
jgi:hypothetical protein